MRDQCQVFDAKTSIGELTSRGNEQNYLEHLEKALEDAKGKNEQKNYQGAMVFSDNHS